MSEQCDALIGALRKRRDQLLECIRQDKELRIHTLRDQVTSCTNHLQSTTGLLQFCIEALKENDCSAFLQVSRSITVIVFGDKMFFQGPYDFKESKLTENVIYYRWV